MDINHDVETSECFNEAFTYKNHYSLIKKNKFPFNFKLLKIKLLWISLRVTIVNIKIPFLATLNS